MSSADSEPPRTPADALYQRVLHGLRNFWPAPVHINGRERLRVAVGVGLGVLLVALLSRWWAPAGSAAGAAASMRSHASTSAS